MTTTTTHPDLASLVSKLFPFQREGYAFGVSMGGKVGIFDDMGLGKTIQAIALLLHYHTVWPALIVVPSTLKVQWKFEVLKWAPSLCEADVHIITKGSKPIRDEASIVIVGYSMAQSMFSTAKKKGLKCILETNRYKMVVCDESHYLKNRKSLRARFLVPLIRCAKYKVLLSGTPMLNRPEELFMQIRALNIDAILNKEVLRLAKEKGDPAGLDATYKKSMVFSTFYKFAARYCNGHQGRFGYDTTGCSRVKELHGILTRHVMIRRLKMNVLTQLPKKMRQRVLVDITPSKQRAIEKQYEEIKSKMEDTSGTLREQMRRLYEHKHMIMELYRMSCDAKIPACVEYVKMMMENLGERQEKIIIFAHHRAMLDALEVKAVEPHMKRTKNYKGYIRIDGSVASKDRHQLVQAFQNNPECFVALLSIRACNVGLNMTASHNVVFCEMDWNPGNNLQAEDRVHRIGQTQTCHLHYIISPVTFDDKMWRMNNRKMAVVSSVLDGKRETMFTRKQQIERRSEPPPAKRVKLNNDAPIVPLLYNDVEHSTVVVDTSEIGESTPFMLQLFK